MTRRVQTGIQFMDGGDQTLLRRMRAHANYTETIPIVLLAMAAAEVAQARSGCYWLVVSACWPPPHACSNSGHERLGVTQGYWNDPYVHPNGSFWWLVRIQGGRLMHANANNADVPVMANVRTQEKWSQRFTWYVISIHCGLRWVVGSCYSQRPSSSRCRSFAFRRAFISQRLAAAGQS